MKDWLIKWWKQQLLPKRTGYKLIPKRIVIKAETSEEALKIYYSTHNTPVSSFWDII